MQNLLAGLRFARTDKFSVSVGQLVALAAVCVGVIVTLSFPFGADEFAPDWVGLTSWAAIGFLITVVVLLIAHLQNARSLPFAIQLLAGAPWFLTIIFLAGQTWPDLIWTQWFLTVVGFLLVSLIALRSFTFLNRAVVALLLAIAVAVPGIGWYRFVKPNVFYALQQGGPGPAEEIDVERVFREQQKLTEQTVMDLLPQRPGHPDIYFVGFAGNADEPVFDRDVRWVHQWFDKNLATGGRSVVLSAGRQTMQSGLLASPFNLQDVLAGIGRLIDPNEDSLFLYLASHGSASANLEVSNGSLPLQPLQAEFIRQALDDAGIRWRIIVISACYAGSFIDSLADEQTLIMTAASADKTSFGCGWESEMTWFADALFKQSLNKGMGLREAFESARQHILAREQQDNIPPSDPQIFIGDAMRQRLAAIETAVGLIE
ncbi:MAG: hypothetical protein HKM98_10845 [Gammaproteobacteria bacterium]|nr:hypothetical protein [Gammaproteobacteria bacterium]